MMNPFDPDVKQVYNGFSQTIQITAAQIFHATAALSDTVEKAVLFRLVTFSHFVQTVVARSLIKKLISLSHAEQTHLKSPRISVANPMTFLPLTSTSGSGYTSVLRATTFPQITQTPTV